MVYFNPETVFFYPKSWLPNTKIVYFYYPKKSFLDQSIQKNLQFNYGNRVAGAAEVIDEALAWLPATTAAVTLRLLALDAAVIYHADKKPMREVLPAYRYIQHPVFSGNDEVATVSGNPAVQTERPLFPSPLLARLPPQPVEFELGLRVHRGGDDEHLVHLVPTGTYRSQCPYVSQCVG